MNITKTPLEDLFVIENLIFKDDRGYLSEVYKHESFFEELSFQNILELEVESKKGVLRGLHYQLEPFSQAKLVRVVDGAILDVVVDIRKKSKTFGKYFSIELSDNNKKQLFVPRGFAHGYYVLSSSAKMIYKMDNIYKPDFARGIRFDDEDIGIEWNLFCEPSLSEQDLILPSFKKAELFG